MNLWIKPFLFVSIPLVPVVRGRAADRRDGRVHPGGKLSMPVAFLYMYTYVIPHTAAAACRHVPAEVYIYLDPPAFSLLLLL